MSGWRFLALLVWIALLGSAAAVALVTVAQLIG